MKTEILTLNRLTPKILKTIDLKTGGHKSREDGLCAMEAVAWLAGREHTDHPPCVCPVIGAFVRSWNDGLPSDEDRNCLLRPILPKLIGTKSDAATEQKRADLVFVWLARDAAPASLRLAGLADEAAAIETAKDDAALYLALKSAASYATAARTAAWNAAWNAAWDAARAAAWDAAWEAARAAARDAARDAAWEAAWEAARAAAWNAAWNAAKQKFEPLIAAQQQSAQVLLLTLTEV
jgi:hypothetical protein